MRGWDHVRSPQWFWWILETRDSCWQRWEARSGKPRGRASGWERSSEEESTDLHPLQTHLELHRCSPLRPLQKTRCPYSRRETSSDSRCRGSRSPRWRDSTCQSPWMLWFSRCVMTFCWKCWNTSVGCGWSGSRWAGPAGITRLIRLWSWPLRLMKLCWCFWTLDGMISTFSCTPPSLIWSILCEEHVTAQLSSSDDGVKKWHAPHICILTRERT